MRVRVIGSQLGTLACVGMFAGACATSTGSMRSRYDVASSPRGPSAAQEQERRDSIAAQAIADREGPGVRIHAQFSNIVANRRVRASFSVDDDAYVLVGHVDAEGTVRVVFPADPSDDGFLKGGKSYQTNEFFGGFTDAYRSRAQFDRYGRAGTFQPAAYDGGYGYLFIIASWRPMRFEQLATSGAWDTFDISDDSYKNNPRPAIQELAALIAGENRETYTLKFASYTSTSDLSPFYSRSAYGNELCGNSMGFGFSTFGFASSPFSGAFASVANYSAAIGSPFYYRGNFYEYSPGGGCYYRSGFGYGSYSGGFLGYTPVQRYPFRTPASSTPNPTPAVGHTIAAGDSPRNPTDPSHPIGGKIPAATQGTGEQSGATGEPGFVPHYRDRGLLTVDDPSRRHDANDVNGSSSTERTRPSIQVMIAHRSGDDHGNRPRSSEGDSRNGFATDGGATRNGRSRDANDGSTGISRRQSDVARTTNSDGSASGNTQGTRSTRTSDGNRSTRQTDQARGDTPRTDAPRVERSAPAPRSESPRAETTRSAPASTSSGSSSSSSGAASRPSGASGSSGSSGSTSTATRTPPRS